MPESATRDVSPWEYRKATVAEAAAMTSAVAEIAADAAARAAKKAARRAVAVAAVETSTMTSKSQSADAALLLAARRSANGLAHYAACSVEMKTSMRK